MSGTGIICHKSFACAVILGYMIITQIAFAFCIDYFLSTQYQTSQ